MRLPAGFIVDILTKRKDEDYLRYILRIRENKAATMVKLADIEDNSKTATELQKTKYWPKMKRHLMNWPKII